MITAPAITTDAPPETPRVPGTRTTCLDCSAQIQPELFRVRCDRCSDAALAQDKAAQQAEWMTQRKAKWKDVLRMFDALSFEDHKHLWFRQSVEARAAGNDWMDRHLKGKPTMGLGLVGDPGTGKTVTAGYLAYQTYLRGYSVAITSDPRLCTLAEDASKEAQEEVRRLITADLLVLDDIGQCCGSPLARRLLLRVVHERDYAGRRQLWTSQGGTNYIAAQLGCKVTADGTAVLTEDVAAFLRRLRPPFHRYVTINPQR